MCADVKEQYFFLSLLFILLNCRSDWRFGVNLKLNLLYLLLICNYCVSALLLGGVILISGKMYFVDLCK